MKRLLMFFPLAALFAAPLLCMGADLIWLEKDHDFGCVPASGGKRCGSARFVNPGPDTLLVVEARTRCSCTYVEYPEDEILPGDTATVRFFYDPSGKSGSIRQSVRLVFSDSSTSLIRLSGNVVPSLSE